MSATLSTHFIVDPILLDRANDGDGKAQFQIGLQAREEKRFGFAIGFLNLAELHGYPEAKRVLIETRKQLFEEVNN